MTLPLSKVDIPAGYGLAFGLLAMLQAIVVVVLGFGILDLHAAHGAWPVGLLAIGNALLGMALGLFVTPSPRRSFRQCSSCQR